MISGLLAISVCLVVLCYYLFVWAQVGRDPSQPAVVPLYDAPRGLSPAMLRYVWKQKFDDRVFWAGLLSLVSKGLATIEDNGGGATLRPTPAAAHPPELPEEERVLWDWLLPHGGKKRVPLTMLTDKMILAIAEMSLALRKAALGRWFEENRSYVVNGAVLSVVPVCLAAHPRAIDEWIAFVVEFGVMAPAGLYLSLLVARYRDLYRASRNKMTWPLLRRATLLLGLLLPCAAGVTFGSVMLLMNFGWLVLAVAASMITTNLVFLHLMKAPTGEGARLLAEIAGFREFLGRVEQLPMNLPEAPGQKPRVYEKFLPYAVALEVEQEWSDKFLALVSTYHQEVPGAGAHSYYLGMWEGKPVEVIIARKR